jgi:hypothetical protein
MATIIIKFTDNARKQRAYKWLKSRYQWTDWPIHGDHVWEAVECERMVITL